MKRRRFTTLGSAAVAATIGTMLLAPLSVLAASGVNKPSRSLQRPPQLAPSTPAPATQPDLVVQISATCKYAAGKKGAMVLTVHAKVKNLTTVPANGEFSTRVTARPYHGTNPLNGNFAWDHTTANGLPGLGSEQILDDTRSYGSAFPSIHFKVEGTVDYKGEIAEMSDQNTITMNVSCN